jgi:hypothetical protein
MDTEKRPSERAEGRLKSRIGRFASPVNYFSYKTSGAGAAWISWNWGSGRRSGALASPVQQQEAASNANAETTSAEMMRIMGSFTLDFEWIEDWISDFGNETQTIWLK